MPATFIQRPYFLLGAALALPVVVLVVLQLVFALNREREDIERQTLARAAAVSELTDAMLESDFAAMRVLATSPSFVTHDWAASYRRGREVIALNPAWRDIILSDLRTRREIFDLSQPYSASGEALKPIADMHPASANPIVGDLSREGAHCPCAYVHLPVSENGALRYLLTVALDPRRFQNLLVRHTPAGVVSSISDARGVFIARSLNFEDRVGTPGSPYLRLALASGRASGIYDATTYEGFQNKTAFVRSPSSGWSAQMAIASLLIDRPRLLSYLTVGVGALIAFAIAAGLIFWALRDIAERRRADVQIAQTQKLEAIGQLTGGVAHDFNNLLTVMIGGLNLLLRRIEDPKQREIAEHMLDAAKRGDKLTRQLLAFSRGKSVELGPVDLHALVPGMEELLRRSIDPTAKLEFDLDPDARWVMSDANQLELAILNLVINARDAMPDGGRIEVSVRSTEAPNLVALAVADDGMGMPKDISDRALEPFFTTKPAGKGTGLGLAQVFGAARQSGGSVEIESAIGRGTVVRMLLPRTEPPRETPKKKTAPAAPPARTANGQRVLVVDDEPGVRRFMAETLREAGYNATEAEDPGAALRLLHNDPPELLLTDYSMPGMTGLELAERARAEVDGLRVLIVSGYADAAALEASAARPALLRKPFDERALLNAVESALAG
ncbi:MAG: response regulator [Proteobacteria bacterium]|nr:response regulator [Pseudomonadota bacterium]